MIQFPRYYTYRGYYTLAWRYEVYLRVEIIFHEWAQRVFRRLHSFYSVPNKGMTSAISSLVRIRKICHSYPGCTFIWNLLDACVRRINFQNCRFLTKHFTFFVAPGPLEYNKILKQQIYFDDCYYSQEHSNYISYS